MTPQTSATATRPSVLIVDDDQTALVTFQEILIAEGYEVRVAQTAAAGLSAAAAHPPDVVLLDLHLPLTGGLECLRNLRARPGTRNVAVAAITGDYFVDETLASELSTLGARIHFKPLWEDDLRRIVRGLLARGNPVIR